MFSKRQSWWNATEHYFRLVWLDAFTLACLAALAFGLSSVQPFHRDVRVFPIWLNKSTGLWEGPAEYSYPKIPHVLGIVNSAIAIGTIPIVAVLFMQIWVRSFWDANAAIWGLLKALVLMTTLQIALKQYIGGFRPYFFSVCNPSSIKLATRAADMVPYTKSLALYPNGYQRVFATVADCQGTSNDTTPNVKDPALKQALQSFPSGHAGIAFAVGVFLSLYLNAKLKAFADYHTSLWKVVVVLLPLVSAALIAGGLMIDHNHHPSDILTGILLGSSLALSSYRAHYASLFSYHTNHIPLPYSATGKSFDYVDNQSVSDTSVTNSFTRSTSWWKATSTTGGGEAEAEDEEAEPLREGKGNKKTRARYVAVGWPRSQKVSAGDVGTGNECEDHSDGDDGSCINEVSSPREMPIGLDGAAPAAGVDEEENRRVEHETRRIEEALRSPSPLENHLLELAVPKPENERVLAIKSGVSSGRRRGEGFRILSSAS